MSLDSSISINRCLQACYRSALDLKDPQIRSNARFQRIVAQYLQAGALTLASLGTAWEYNDPYRPNNASLRPLFYVSAISGSIVLVVAHIDHMRRMIQNNMNEPSWVIDSLWASAIASGAFSATLAIVQIKVQEIADVVLEIDQALSNWSTTTHEEQNKQIDQCYQDVFEWRDQITSSSCLVCVLPAPTARFYQAYPVEFSQVLCAPPLSSYEWYRWNAMHNLSMEPLNGEGSCGDILYYKVYDASELQWLLYMTAITGIHPSMNLSVDEEGDCKHVYGSGYKLESPAYSLCDFETAKAGVCTNELWMNLSTNYLLHKESIIVPNYESSILFDQASILTPQCIVSTSVWVFSIIGILVRYFSKRWGDGSETSVEMTHLNAEVSDT